MRIMSQKWFYVILFLMDTSIRYTLLRRIDLPLLYFRWDTMLWPTVSGGIICMYVRPWVTNFEDKESWPGQPRPGSIRPHRRKPDLVILHISLQSLIGAEIVELYLDNCIVRCINVPHIDQLTNFIRSCPKPNLGCGNLCGPLIEETNYSWDALSAGAETRSSTFHVSFQ